jgi:hypothetical protein
VDLTLKQLPMIDAQSRQRGPIPQLFGRFSLPLWVALGLGLLSLGMSLWQFSIPGYLSFYDSGVYLAGSIHLVNGVLPYKDFTFVQPPGILLLMSPLAELSRVVTTHNAYVIARVISALVTAANVTFLALLVRRRGIVAMIICGASLALLPVASLESTSIKLEPYCLCLILAGSLVIFSKREEAGELSNRDLVVSGVLFGLAALVKLWALFPLIALLICLWPSYRTRVLRLLAAATGTFVLLCLPFFLSSPRNFISQVFVEQIARKANFTDSMSLVERLINLTGFPYTAMSPTQVEAIVALSIVALVIVGAFLRRAMDERLDVFLLLSALITVLALLIAPDSYNYYYYFSAPFLLGVFAISLSRLHAPMKKLVDGIGISKAIRRFTSWASIVAGLGLVISLLLYGTTFYSYYMSLWGQSESIFPAISHQIPPGSCVVYLDSAAGLLANRFQTSDPNCPKVVDPQGMWMARGYMLVPPAPAFVKEWQSYFENAQFVVLKAPYNAQYINPGAPTNSSIPWNHELKTWFKTHYHLVFGGTGLHIYANDSNV